MRAGRMKILGLTGSIGMGKSETARMFKQLRIPVFEADAAVHKLLAKNGTAVPYIEKYFPDCIEKGVVDRQALGRKIFGDVALKEELEAIMHPLVRAAENRFLKRMRQQRKHVVVLDIPLLFETVAPSTPWTYNATSLIPLAPEVLISFPVIRVPLPLPATVLAIQ